MPGALRGTDGFPGFPLLMEFPSIMLIFGDGDVKYGTVLPTFCPEGAFAFDDSNFSHSFPLTGLAPSFLLARPVSKRISFSCRSLIRGAWVWDIIMETEKFVVPLFIFRTSLAVRYVCLTAFFAFSI